VDHHVTAPGRVDVDLHHVQGEHGGVGGEEREPDTEADGQPQTASQEIGKCVDGRGEGAPDRAGKVRVCLLYTSDAADE